MRSLFALLLLSLAALGASNVPDNDKCPRTRSGCLHKNDVNYILNLWARIHDTEDADWLNKTIDCIVAEDFQSTNEGSMVFGTYPLTFPISFPSPLLFHPGSRNVKANWHDGIGITNNGIDIPDRATLQNEMLANIEFEAGYPITRGHYTEVISFHSCDQIAFRWQYNGNATGKTKWYHPSSWTFYPPLTLSSTSTSNTENHAFQYKGIDLLTIKKGTTQVEKVTTSAVS
jgi:hypothetical protein